MIHKLIKLVFALVGIVVTFVAIECFLMKTGIITVNFDHPNFPEFLKFLKPWFGG